MKRAIYLSLALVALLLVSSLIIHKLIARTPQQPYREIGSLGFVEFRYYPEAIMATVKNKDTTFQGSSGENFRVLAGYIFGSNDSNEKIAMTAPVHMNFEKDASYMSFVMPQGYNLNNLPTPSGSSIDLHKTEEEYVAVIRFGGYASDNKIKSKRDELKDLLKQEGIEHDNNFRYLGYNAPWDFLFRRNEIIVGIKKETASEIKE